MENLSDEQIDDLLKTLGKFLDKLAIEREACYGLPQDDIRSQERMRQIFRDWFQDLDFE